MRSKLANTEAAKFAVEHEREQLRVEKMKLENQRLFRSLSDEAASAFVLVPSFIIFSMIGGKVGAGLGALPPGTALVQRGSISPSAHSSPFRRPVMGARLSMPSKNSYQRKGLKIPLQPLRPLEPADDPSNSQYIPDRDLVRITSLPGFDSPPERAVWSSLAPAPETDGSSSGILPWPRRAVGTREERGLANLKARFSELENQLVEKSREAIDIRAQLHETQQSLFNAKNQTAKLENLIVARTAEEAGQAQKLKFASDLIMKVTAENEKLRNLIREVGRTASNIVKEKKVARYLREDIEMAISCEVGRRILRHDLAGAVGQGEFVQRLSERHAIAVARWEARRQMMLEEERQRAFLVLQSMKLIDTKIEREGAPHPSSPRDTPQPPGISRVYWPHPSVLVKSEAPAGGTRGRNRIRRRMPDYYSSTMSSASVPSVEEGFVRANAHHQTIGKTLAAGVVALPLRYNECDD
jgi:hypothetical protein